MFDIFYISNPHIDFPQAVKVNDRNEASEKSRTRFCWLIDGDNSYYDFDMLWEPKPWEAKQIHVWPSQHHEHGGTELIPKDHNGDVNYHTETIVRTEFPKIIYLEHGDGHQLSPRGVSHTFQKSRFINDYLGTIKRIVNNHTHEDYIWITSSVCDYSLFDFTWHPSEWQREMLHVFPSNEQKFGDTFYINIQNFLEQVEGLELLEWYDTICFQDVYVPRNPMPVIIHDCDSQADAIKEHVFKSVADGLFTAPLAMFTTRPVEQKFAPTINLWRNQTRAVTPLARSGDPCIIPKTAIPFIKDEMYDYPYVNGEYQDRYIDKPLDIVFLSNGEECVEANYKHLCKIADGRTIHHVKDVEGRIASARAAAAASTTEWFFSINAKLKVDRNFDWDWQPDRLQKPKHYIFNAYNPYTGDTYGHMAAIAWNKKLVNTDTNWGLDFTLSHEHEVIPILSGEAVYGPLEWDLWRTAFREVLKLLAARGDVSSGVRCQLWLDSNDEWTQHGAYDAQHYYNEVAHGDHEKLKLSFEWDWLAKYFYMKYIEWSKPQ